MSSEDFGVVVGSLMIPLWISEYISVAWHGMVPILHSVKPKRLGFYVSVSLTRTLYTLYGMRLRRVPKFTKCHRLREHPKLWA